MELKETVSMNKKKYFVITCFPWMKLSFSVTDTRAQIFEVCCCTFYIYLLATINKVDTSGEKNTLQ